MKTKVKVKGSRRIQFLTAVTGLSVAFIKEGSLTNGKRNNRNRIKLDKAIGELA